MVVDLANWKTQSPAFVAHAQVILEAVTSMNTTALILEYFDNSPEFPFEDFENVGTHCKKLQLLKSQVNERSHYEDRAKDLRLQKKFRYYYSSPFLSMLLLNIYEDQIERYGTPYDKARKFSYNRSFASACVPKKKERQING